MGRGFVRLEVKDLHKSFSKNEVLHGISFSVECGKALGLLGRNGAGKTTTIRIIMNLFEANKGRILLDGQKFIPESHHISYLPEERGLYPKKKVLGQLIYLGQLRGLNSKKSKENALYWLDRLEIEEYKDKKLDTLSKGNQQKVQLAQTFITNPDIVILDEPFSGLDPVNSQILKSIINEQISENKLIIFSSHQMNYVEEFCEDIALIDKGNIVLTGNLKKIQKKYGKNRLTISSVNRSLVELKKVIQREFNRIVKVIEKKKEYLILELRGSSSRKDLLKAVIEKDIDIEQFSTYKPSLEDIFVEKVGEN